MLAKHLELLGNYLWQRSLDQLRAILSEEENRAFNISDYYYLTMIATMDSPTFSEVAYALKVTKPAVSALAKRLGKIGLLEKIKSSEDGRVYFLTVTEKGKRIIESDTKLYENLETAIQKHLTEEESLAMEILMEKVIEEFKNKGVN